MPRKKILWLCSWYPNAAEPFNGDFIQRHARAAALYNDIYVIHVAADTHGESGKAITTIQKENGLTEHIVYFKKKLTGWGRLRAHYRLLRSYRHAIRNYLKENGKPDWVHVHVPIWAGVPAMWIKKKYNIPYILTEHWGIYNDIEQQNYLTKSNWFKRYTRVIFEKAARFTTVSSFLAEGVNRMVIKKQYEVIPNVVNTESFKYKERNRKTFRFIHVSNMVPLKNAKGILRAFELFYDKNSNAELVMVGDTDPAIREFAAKLALPENVISFRGEVPYVQVAKEMQDADCLVVFSNIENSPCVIGEALCCGLPVITTGVGGITELVDRINSILVEPRNEEVLAKAMKEMITTYEKYDRLRIAENAKARFNYEVTGKRLDEIYTI